MLISETTQNWKIFQIPWLLKTKVHTITHVQATHADSSYHLFRCGKVVFIHLKILPLTIIISKFFFLKKKFIIMFWWPPFCLCLSRHNRRIDDKLEDTRGRVYTDDILDDKQSLLQNEKDPSENNTENVWLADITDEDSWTVEYFELWIFESCVDIKCKLYNVIKSTGSLVISSCLYFNIHIKY